MTKRVIILGMGDSREQYLAAMLDPKGGDNLDGEVWGINLIGTVVRCDRIIAMDGISLWKRVFGEHALKRMATIGVPIYTSVPDPAWPTAVRYPIEDHYRNFGNLYLNNSVAYAVALAMMEGATDLVLFGCDYNYEGRRVHENGRPCLEYWLGVAAASGVRITIGTASTLMDMNKGHSPYGYASDFDWDAVKAAAKQPRLVEAAE